MKIKILFLIQFLFISILNGNILLNEEFSPKSQAIAGASVAFSEPEAGNILTNPAGISGLKGINYQVGWSGIISDEIGINYEYVLAGMPLPKKKLGNIGIGVFFFNLGGNLSIYDETGIQIDTINANSFMLNISYANTVWIPNTIEKINYGINIKYFNSKLQYINSSGIGIDMGLNYKLTVKLFNLKIPQDNLSLGLKLENIGYETGYYERKSLPFRIRIGGGYKIIPEKISSNWLLEIFTEFDYNTLDYSDSGYLSEKIGMNIDFSKNFSIRIGYKIEPKRKTSGFSAGFGLNYKINKTVVGIDYGLGFFDLSTRHLIAIKGNF